MKNITTLLIPLIFTLVACNEGSPQINRQAIHDQVKQKGEDIYLVEEKEVEKKEEE